MPHVQHVGVVDHGVAGVDDRLPHGASGKPGDLDVETSQLGDAVLGPRAGTGGDVGVPRRVDDRRGQDDAATLGCRHDDAPNLPVADQRTATKGAEPDVRAAASQFLAKPLGLLDAIPLIAVPD